MTTRYYDASTLHGYIEGQYRINGWTNNAYGIGALMFYCKQLAENSENRLVVFSAFFRGDMEFFAVADFLAGGKDDTR